MFLKSDTYFLKIEIILSRIYRQDDCHLGGVTGRGKL